MPQTTVRISEATHHLLKELSRAKKEPMQSILETAVEEYRRRHFLERVNDAYAALRADAGAWAEIEAERREWDPTLGDGLTHDESRTEDGERVPKKKASQKIITGNLFLLLSASSSPFFCCISRDFGSRKPIRTTARGRIWIL